MLRDEVRVNQGSGRGELMLGHGEESGFYSKCSGRPFGYY